MPVADSVPISRIKIMNSRKISLILLIFVTIVSTFYFHTLSNQIRFSPIQPESEKSAEDVQIGYYFHPCNCIKHINLTSRVPSASMISHCSDEADWKGRGQLIITYGLYNDSKVKVKDPGDNFSYCVDGIMKNVGQMKILYPGWSMRIYSNLDLDPDLCKFACLDEITWCDIRNTSRFHMLYEYVNPRLWRFLLLGDPTVDIFLSRDLDSWIVEREIEAVSEWLSSNFTFHTARDLPRISRAIQAGALGVKNYQLMPNETAFMRQEILRQGILNPKSTLDEHLLNELIFEAYPTRILVHDAYRCIFNFSNKVYVPTVPFPKQRKSRHIFFAKDTSTFIKYQVPPCPVACRPSYGKHWKYC